MISISDFPSLMKDYKDFLVVGQSNIVGYPMQDVDLAKHMYDLSLNEEPIENVDALVPCYLKDVEAKKICL